MSFLYSLFHAKVFPSTNPGIFFAGKKVLVTGANCGLGFEAALKFTALGASTVVLAGGSAAKGEAAAAAAAAEIQTRTG